MARLLNRPDGDGLHASRHVIRLGGLADDVSEANFVTLHVLQVLEVLDRVGIDRGRGFDLHGMQNVAFLDHQVDLALLRISIEPNIAQVGASVHVALQNLGDDECLEYVTRHSPVAQLVGGGPAGEVAYEPGIHEVEFGGFGEGLPDVRPERAQQADDSACLQDGQPRLHGLVINVNGVRDVGGVEELPRARCRSDHKVVELALVFQVDKISDVAFEVCLGVAGPETLPGDVGRTKLRHRTALDALPEVEIDRLFNFSDCSRDIRCSFVYVLGQLPY